MIHITFSLLPPLSALHAYLQVYKVRFRVWDISQSFLSILSTLMEYITVPRLFSSNPPKDTITSTEALALTIEGGILLDRMIDISVEEKGLPIPEEWIDEFEKLEQMVNKIAKDDLEPETPCPTDPKMECTDVGMKRDFTMSSLVESVFDTSPRSTRLDDSLSSIEDTLPEHLRVKEDDEEDEGDGVEGESSLEDALQEDDSRIFEKEYHAIDSPPEGLSTDRIDYSPFLARVLAELDTVEADTSGEILDSDEIPSDSDDEISGNEKTANISQDHDVEIMRQTTISDDEIDIDELYDAMVNANDSDDDEDDDYPPIKYEIRTSSPIFEDRELDFGALESDDETEDITAHFGKTLLLDSIDNEPRELSTENMTPISLNPFSPPKPRHMKPINSDSEDDLLDETITLPTHRKRPNVRTPSPDSPSLPSNTPLALRDSHLHSKVTQIAHSHPTIALIPQTSTFRPTQTSEYGMYTLRPNTSHSRHSSVSSDTPEVARRVDVGGINLYVRILSDRVMVRVGGGWVDLDQYLSEYIGKRESTHRRRSGSVEPLSTAQMREELGFEFVEVEERRGLGGGMRSTSSLGVYHSSPPRGVGGGRNSSLEVRRSVSPFGGQGFQGEDGSPIGVVGGTRRVFVRRK